MAYIDDIDVINDAGNANGDFTIGSGFDTPTDNNSSSTTPIYVEGSACGWMPLKKGVTTGYNATSVISGTPSISDKRRILVGFINYPFADVDAIPITLMRMRFSSATGFTTNYAEWDALAQMFSPYNIPISGHTPIIGHQDSPIATSGTPNYGATESVGWVATTGNNADGKQGGFDWFFEISYVGLHSETKTNNFFSALYDEYYDNEGSGLPGQTSRPIGVLSQSGAFFQSNISFALAAGTGETANTIITESGKTIFFNNVDVDHEIGFICNNPASTHELRVTFTGCAFLWASVGQASTYEIFENPENCDHFKIDGCSFTNGGIFESPPDSVNRYIRNTTFKSCQTGVISDGEFTNNIVDTCYAITVSGDADLSGTQVLTPAVALDTSGLVWNGNYDPDGNLDDMVFSKGATAHHAIEFGTGSPTTMTLRNITVSGFNASNGQNDSVLHIKRTSGTVTINLVGCTGTFSYKSAGATVVVQASVAVTVTVKDKNTLAVIAGVQTSVFLKDSPYTQIMNEDTNASGVASESYAGSTPVDVVVKARKSDNLDDPRYFPHSGINTITSSGLNITVLLEENPFI